MYVTTCVDIPPDRAGAERDVCLLISETKRYSAVEVEEEEKFV